MCGNNITMDIEEYSNWLQTFKIVNKIKSDEKNTLLLIEYMINMLNRGLTCECKIIEM